MGTYHTESSRHLDAFWQRELDDAVTAPVHTAHSQSCVTAFRDAGFAVLDGVFAPAEIREMRRRIEQYRRYVAPRHPNKDWVRRESDGAVGNMYSIEQIDPYFRELGGRRALVDLVCRLTGRPMRFGSVESFDKPPFSGSAAVPHQDGIYWEHTEERLVHIWIPLEEATRANGAMLYWPGSHREGLLDHYRIKQDPVLGAIPDDLLTPLGPPQVAEVRPPQLIVHGDRVVHASNPNSSAQGRTALAVCYFAAHEG